MSTIKSSSANLTLNADGSGNDIKFQSNASEVGSLTDGGVWAGSTFEPTGDTAAGDNAAIGYTAAEGLILTGQGSTDDITIKNDADTTVLNVATGSSDIEISAGDLIFGTAGKGVVLGATTNVDANTLDDYEEGTWTPIIGGSGGTSGQAYSIQGGHYTKVGTQCTVSGYLTFSNKGTITSNLQLKSLPFTTRNAANNIGAVTLARVEAWSLADDHTLCLHIGENGTAGTFTSYAGATSGHSSLTTSEVTNTSSIIFSWTYHTT